MTWLLKKKKICNFLGGEKYLACVRALTQRLMFHINSEMSVFSTLFLVRADSSIVLQSFDCRLRLDMRCRVSEDMEDGGGDERGDKVGEGKLRPLVKTSPVHVAAQTHRTLTRIHKQGTMHKNMHSKS